jgi:hypothetical protein
MVPVSLVTSRRDGCSGPPHCPSLAGGTNRIAVMTAVAIRHVQSVLHALGPDSIGHTVTIGLRRAGEIKQLSLTIAERPAA